MNTDNNREEKPLPGYTSYPENEDIYSQSKKEQYEEEEEHPKGVTEEDKWNEVDAEREGRTAEIHDADDLDIPGAELDDAMEDIGEEDEENNYYSLGGDNHEDLEEDRS